MQIYTFSKYTYTYTFSKYTYIYTYTYIGTGISIRGWSIGGYPNVYDGNHIQETSNKPNDI
jgi:hypothetical protein